MNLIFLFLVNIYSDDDEITVDSDGIEVEVEDDSFISYELKSDLVSGVRSFFGLIHLFFSLNYFIN